MGWRERTACSCARRGRVWDVRKSADGWASEASAAGREAVNGNSLLSTNAQHVYEITRTDAAGVTDTYKFGISGGKVNSSGLSVRAQRQVRALNRASDGYTYQSQIIQQIPAGDGARGAALAAEHDYVYQYLEQFGAKPEGNIRP